MPSDLHESGNHRAMSAVELARSTPAGPLNLSEVERLYKAGDATSLMSAVDSTEARESWRLREHIAKRLGDLRSPIAVPVLCRMATSDADEGPRIFATRALRMIGDPDALPAVRSALDDPSVGVKSMAIQAVEAFRDRESL